MALAQSEGGQRSLYRDLGGGGEERIRCEGLISESGKVILGEIPQDIWFAVKPVVMNLK